MLSSCEMIVNNNLFILLACDIIMPGRIIFICDVRIYVYYLPVSFISKK